MKTFLDASGLNQYHIQVKEGIDSEFNRVDTSIFDLKTNVDSSILSLVASDTSLSNAIDAISHERDTKYEELSDRIDNLVQNSMNVSFTIEPGTIYVGDSSTLTFSVNCINSATSIQVLDPSNNVIASGSGTTLNGSTTVTPSAEGVLKYKATTVINGTTSSVVSNVECVRPIYYGSGSSYTDATNVASIRSTPDGKYIINVSSLDKYIFFVIPQSMTINDVTMNGLTVPMSSSSVTKNGQPYVAYKSINGYDTGTYNVVLS
jgi:hypothetical protein